MLRRDDARVAERAPCVPAGGARATTLAAARILPLPAPRTAGDGNGTPSAVAAPEGRGVRWSRVMAAQARIAVGFYDRREVRASLADAVLRELERH